MKQCLTNEFVNVNGNKVGRFASEEVVLSHTE